jgi:hypothetical protein
MMSKTISQADLEAYLDESLSVENMASIEHALRAEPRLAERLAAINARRDSGVHSLGEIWRRHRLTCPTREQLGSYLLQAVSAELAGFIELHLKTSQCRMCLANLDDLKHRQTDDARVVETRRKKYFQSSAGHLRKR